MNTKNILIRSISGIALGIIFIIAIFLFRPLFYFIIYALAALMLLEWHNMTKNSMLCTLIGQVAIPLPIASLLFMSHIDDSGWLLFTFFCIIWSVDTMAMFGGKLIEGPKLAPTISPNKTISGLVIGVLSAVIIVNMLTLIPAYSLPFLELTNLTIYTIIIGITAQISDLLVSYFKRKFDIKDTGTIIPGHGGVLDRFDSIILTAPLIVIFLVGHL